MPNVTPSRWQQGRLAAEPQDYLYMREAQSPNPVSPSLKDKSPPPCLQASGGEAQHGQSMAVFSIYYEAEGEARSRVEADPNCYCVGGSTPALRRNLKGRAQRSQVDGTKKIELDK